MPGDPARQAQSWSAGPRPGQLPVITETYASYLGHAFKELGSGVEGNACQWQSRSGYRL